jgi:uncharacterized membrane protein
MKKLLMILFLIFSFTLFGKEAYIKGKVLKLEDIVYSSDENDEIRETQIYNVKILEGKDENKEILIEFPIYNEEAYNLEVEVGDNVVIYEETGEDGETKFFIADIDKRNWIYALTTLFVIITLLLARMKGLKSLIALSIVILVIYNVFIPGIIEGYSPIALSVLTAFFASIVTIYLMTGFNGKGIVAILGSIAGVVVAGVLSYYFSYGMGLSGYTSIEALNFAPLLEGIKMKEIISAGVILGSMGAVMDVAMSISSALDELRLRNENLSKREIFKSGMNIGSDIIGTMVNTLILAYIGSSLLTAMFLFIQKDQYPLIRILNFESILVEILRSLCGSIGILIAVPSTAYISSLIIKKNVK